MSHHPSHMTIDGLEFALRWSPRRTTIAITVHADRRLGVAAPAGASLRTVSAAVTTRLPWVRRRLAKLDNTPPPPPPLRLAVGERVPYLGRERTIVRAPATTRRIVSLNGTSLRVHETVDGSAQASIIAWYEDRVRARVSRRVDFLAPIVGVYPAGIIVRDLGRRRWAICDCRSAKLTFHWQLATLPPALIDYVVVHELCHLLVPNHGPAFWREVARVLPDVAARRRRLRAQPQMTIDRRESAQRR